MLKVCFYWRIVKLKIDCYCPHYMPHTSAFHTWLRWRKWPQNNIILNVSDEISDLAYCLVAAALESGLWRVILLDDGGYTSGIAQLPFALVMNFFINMLNLSVFLCYSFKTRAIFSAERFESAQFWELLLCWWLYKILHFFISSGLFLAFVLIDKVIPVQNVFISIQPRNCLVTEWLFRHCLPLCNS